MVIYYICIILYIVQNITFKKMYYVRLGEFLFGIIKKIIIITLLPIRSTQE